MSHPNPSYDPLDPLPGKAYRDSLPGSNNTDIEIELQNAPDDVAEEFEKWQLAELAREECEAKLYTRFKASSDSITATEIKALIHSDEWRHAARIAEIMAQKGHERVSKRFMSLMKRADLRGRAF